MPLLWSPKRQRLWKPGLGQAEIDWSHPLARGLIGCWLFNEAAGAKLYDLAQHRAGTITNLTPPWWITDAPGGTGLQFNNTGYVAFTGSPVLTPPLSIVVAGRGADTYGTAVDIGHPTAGHWYGIGQNYIPVMGAKVSLDADDDHGAWGTTTIGTNDYWQAVGVFRSTTYRAIYLNGKYENSNTTSYNPTSQTTLRFGGANRYDSNDFGGKLFYVYLFNRELLALEIQQLYADPFAFLRPSPRRRIAIYVPEAGGPLQATAGIAAVTSDGLNATAAPSSAASATAGIATATADGLGATAALGQLQATAGMASVTADGLGATASPGTAPATAGMASVTADGLAASASPTTAAQATAGMGAVTVDGLSASAAGASTASATAGIGLATADGLAASAAPASAAPATAGMGSVTADGLGASAAGAGTAGATAGLPTVTADGLSATASTGLQATAGIASVTADGLNASAAPASAAQATAGIAEVTVAGLGASTVGDQTAVLRASNLDPWALDLPVVDGTVSTTDMAVLAGCYAPAATGAASLRSANLDPWALGFPVIDDSVTAGDRAMLAGAYSEWTYDPPAARVLLPAEEIGIRGASL